MKGNTLKQLIAPMTLALATIIPVYWTGSQGEYSSLNLSIDTILTLGLSWVMVLPLLLIYLVRTRYHPFLSIYATTFLLGSSVLTCAFEGISDILLTPFAVFVIGSLALAGIMLFLVIIPNLRRSGSGKSRKS